MACIKTYPLPTSNEACMQFAGRAGTISRFNLGGIGVWTIVFDSHGNIKINLQTPEFEIPIYEFTGPIGDFPAEYTFCNPDNTFEVDSAIFDTISATRKLESGDRLINIEDLEHSFTYCDSTQNLDLAIDVKVAKSDNNTFIISFKVYDRATRVAAEFAADCAAKNECTTNISNIPCSGMQPPEGRKVIFKYKRRLDLT